MEKEALEIARLCFKRSQNLAIIEGMKPSKNSYDPQGDLFKVELDRIVDTKHGLVKLAATVEWSRMEDLFGKTYCPDNGRPGIPTRLMVALHYLSTTADPPVAENTPTT